MTSGFVTLVGRSNVGKSTLLNGIIGTKIAIVTPKPQTTRRPVRGILSEDRGQIVFVDTPGVFLGKKDILSQRLHASVEEHLDGIDAILYVVDPTRPFGPEEELLQEMLRKSSQPTILVINKMDLPVHERPFTNEARTIDVGQIQTIELSALRGTDRDQLITLLFERLPEGPELYPAEQKTDLTAKAWLAELIREKFFLRLREEVPYAVHVEVEEFEQRDEDHYYASANIIVSDERYKPIVIGKGGSMLKQVGSDARKEWESATQKKIYLDLHVDVDPKWAQRYTV